MANTYKNIVITPNTGSSTGDPSIVFSGANANVNTDITLRVYPTSNGTLSFEGSAGQLLTITNDLSNTIFSVNDVSGLPLIEVNVTSQQITFGQYYGNVGIGTSAANSSIYKLDVAGDIRSVLRANSWSGTFKPDSFLGNYAASIVTSPSYIVNTAPNWVNWIGLLSTPTANSYNGSSAYIIGTYNIPKIINSATSDKWYMYGTVTFAYRNSANDYANVSGSAVTGAYTVAGHTLSLPNTAFSAYALGTESDAYNYSGTVTTLYGLSAYVGVGASGNNYANTLTAYSIYTSGDVGLFSGVSNTVANVGTYYDAYFAGMTARTAGSVTNKYGVYQVKTDHTNYFGGPMTLANANVTIAGSNVLAAIAAGNTYAVSVGAASNTWANTKVSSVTGTAGQIFSSGGTTPTLNLISTGVSATTYGGSTQIPAIVVDAFGRITSASNVAFSSGSMDYAYANAVGAGANTWANTKLSNTSGVSFAGNLYFPTGNVGIGITAPTSNLHVVGSANVSTSLRVGGRVNIGSAPLANIQVYAGVTPNTLDSYVVLTDATIGSNTTSSATAFTSNPSTVAASFTLSSLNHFLATQGTIGAGSAITNQRGFYAFNSLTGATNNYGFYSDIASGANRWNFYASGTAYNFFQGGSGFGTGPTAYSQIRMGGTAPSSSALSYSLYADQTAPSTTTDEFASYYSTPSTAAASFTLGTMFHFIALQGTIGAGSAITNQFGFYVGNNLTGATNNYGYYSNIPVGANRWNLYMNGTANNYIAGNLGIGITNPTSNLHVIGTANISSATLLVAGQNVISAIASKVDTITSNSTSRIWANSVTTSGIETVFLDLASSGVTATTYGGTGQVPAIVVDAYGRITSASNVASSGLANTSGISFNGSLYFPTGNIGIGRASATNPLDVYYTGADLQGGAFSVDAANSSLNTYHAFSLRIPATGSQRGFSIAKGIESFGFASFTNQINGANTPGFELGSGLAARDTKLYRTGAGILDIDNTIQVNTSISIGRNATAYALDVNGSINVSSGGAIAGGFTVASFNAGSNIASYGTWTPNPTNGNYQYVTSNGSVTIAVPTSNCAIDVLWYNGVSPGSVTFSGYQAASGGGGDSYLTTANYEYILSIRRINGVSTYVWKALQ